MKFLLLFLLIAFSTALLPEMEAQTTQDQNFNAETPALRGLDYTLGGVRFQQISPTSISQMATLSSTPDFIITPNSSDLGILYNIDNVGTINGPNVGAFDYRLQSADGSEFKIASMEADMSAKNPANGYVFLATITGYRDGISQVSDNIDFDVSDASGTVTYSKVAPGRGGTLTFNSAWANIDEIRFTGGSGASISLLILDDLVFDTPTLPIELSYFEGAYNKREIELKWETFTEQNNDRFDIEWSPNGTDFEKIGSLKGNGSSSTAQQYSFVHNRGLSPENYYRLKQVDFDGTTWTSELILIKIGSNLFFYDTVFPNPSSDGIFYVSNFYEGSKGPSQIRVFDVLGRAVLAEEQWIDQQQLNVPLDLSNLENGWYLLQLNQGDSFYTQRILIQR